MIPTRNFIAIGTLLMLCACHKDAGHAPPAAPQPDVNIYVGGGVVLSSGIKQAIYFKNNIDKIVVGGTSDYDILRHYRATKY